MRDAPVSQRSFRIIIDKQKTRRCGNWDTEPISIMAEERIVEYVI